VRNVTLQGNVCNIGILVHLADSTMSTVVVQQYTTLCTNFYTLFL